MKKWNWQWLAVLGLLAVMHHGVSWFMAEAEPDYQPPIQIYREDPDAIKVYYEYQEDDSYLARREGGDWVRA